MSSDLLDDIVLEERSRFVRFTYQECEVVEGQGGAYKALGPENDIRMMDGFIDVGDEHSALKYNVVAGKLHQVGHDELRVQRTASVEYRNNGASLTRAFQHVCSGCGREFDSNRRQLPGKRAWCGRDECRKEAARLRAQDYRTRKSE